jgi:hypothetical protein
MTNTLSAQMLGTSPCEHALVSALTGACRFCGATRRQVAAAATARANAHRTSQTSHAIPAAPASTRRAPSALPAR